MNMAIDSAELYAMCQWWAEYRKLQLNTKLEAYKRMCAMSAAYKQFRTIASRFGLTPADRASLDVNDADQEENPFAALLPAANRPQANQRANTNRESGHKYIDDVLRGRTPACKRLKAACQRHLDDLRNAKKKKIYFDEEKANYAIDFAPLLTLSSGEWNGTTLYFETLPEIHRLVLFGWRCASDDMRGASAARS